MIVGLSGGVDSAVAAALLLEEGYQVIGVSLSLWKVQETPSPGGDYQDAQKVAEHLGIPWLLVNQEEAFREKVVKYYLKSIEAGKTPNPCIVCNKGLKWKTLLEVADKIGAAYVATGHYARRYESQTIEIHKAKDAEKDQSYFLSILGQLELARTLFPLGEYLKDQVRFIAKTMKIPVATRLESQDLCFLGGLSQKAFIKEYAPDLLTKGEIVHVDGRVIGEHSGLAGYTIGQRKGLQIAHAAPLYVIRKDLINNRLIVGEREYQGVSNLTGGSVNWISGIAPGTEFRAIVKIRSRAIGREANVRLLDEGRLEVQFDQMIRDITPGQAMVMYQDNICLGMAFIE